MSYLVWDSPNGPIAHEVKRMVSIIGRAEVSDLVVEDASVSSRHALLQFQDDERLQITDLGSANGTRINGAKLTPEMPSTLEPGDMIHLGGMLLTYRLVLPGEARAAVPAAAIPRPPPRPPRKPRPQPARAAPPARRPAKVAKRAASPPSRPPAAARVGVRVRVRVGASPVWKLVAFGALFVLIAAIGAIFALQMDRDQPVQMVRIVDPPRTEGQSSADPASAAAERRVEPQDGDRISRDIGPRRAPPGELPPSGFASVDLCPSLLEVDGERYFAVRLDHWNEATVKVLGADGRLYEIGRRRVTRIVERVDVESRARSQHGALDAADVDGRLSLARWCRKRQVRDVARMLAREVLELRPGQAEAKRLLAEIGDA